MSGGIGILGEDDEASSERTERITIRNNLVYDMSGQWGGDSHFLVMTRSPLNVKIDHNTIIHDGVVVLVDDGQSYGFEFTNNVTPHNIYGIFGEWRRHRNGCHGRVFSRRDRPAECLRGWTGGPVPGRQFLSFVVDVLRAVRRCRRA